MLSTGINKTQIYYLKSVFASLWNFLESNSLLKEPKFQQSTFQIYIRERKCKIFLGSHWWTDPNQFIFLSNRFSTHKISILSPPNFPSTEKSAKKEKNQYGKRFLSLNNNFFHWFHFFSSIPNNFFFSDFTQKENWTEKSWIRKFGIIEKQSKDFSISQKWIGRRIWIWFPSSNEFSPLSIFPTNQNVCGCSSRTHTLNAFPENVWGKSFYFFVSHAHERGNFSGYRCVFDDEIYLIW